MCCQVSIIVPVYNMERYLRQCVDSLLVQTFDNIEVILIDDESTDSSPAICDEYQAKDSRVRVIHQENQGLAGVRNVGIKACTSPYFMIIDSDDWLEPNAVELLLHAIEETKADICISDFYSNYKARQVYDSFINLSQGLLSKEQVLLLQENCLCCSSIGNPTCSTNIGTVWARIYRKQFVVDNNLSFIVGLKRMQDSIFNLYAFDKAKTVYYITQPTWHYRIWEGSASNRADYSFDKTGSQVLAAIHEFMQNAEKEDSLQAVYDAKCVCVLYEIIQKKILPQFEHSTMQKLTAEWHAIVHSDPYCHALEHVDPSYLSKNQRLMLPLLRHGWLLPIILAYRVHNVVSRKY